MNTLLLNSINVKSLLIVLGIVAFLAVFFAILIILVSKACAVPVDEKTEKIKENLAGANCGGCGYAGCADFAKALSEGKAEITGCGPTPNQNKAVIAEILGIPFSAEEQKYAVVHCAGGKVCKDKYEYVGNEGCVSEISIQGGKKLCATGCVGEGSCAEKCPYLAIKIVNGVSYVNKALCEACGVCAKSCPKNLIELIPKSSKVYVACSSHCKGKEVMDACKVGCIGCGLCAKNCPNGAIEMVNSLPVIDYKKCTGCKVCVKKCPRKCILEI